MSPPATQLRKALRTLRWLPAYGWQRVVRRPARGRPAHLLIALADHFEPSIVPGAPGVRAPMHEQEWRGERRCRPHPAAGGGGGGAPGPPLPHTHFFPPRGKDKRLLGRPAPPFPDRWGGGESHL